MPDSAVVLPLKVNDRAIGVFFCERDEAYRALTPEEISRTRKFVAYAGEAIKRSLLAQN